MRHPKNLYYHPEHTWLRVKGNKAWVGITDFAQKELGEIVYLELPQVGTEIKQGESFTKIESVKAVSDVYGPASGEIVEINEELLDYPDIINQDPYEQGWMLVIKLADPDEIGNLLDAQAYVVSLQK
jgi:glycine cleavage system H protein